MPENPEKTARFGAAVGAGVWGAATMAVNIVAIANNPAASLELFALEAGLAESMLGVFIYRRIFKALSSEQV